MPWTRRTRARARPPRPAPIIVTWVVIVVPRILYGTPFQRSNHGTPFQVCQDGRMARTSGRADRRTDALSRERIVQAAIEILDAEGESGLTFRALATRLSTGAGAIYWHVASKGELLAATT